jgi:hypothetical protein
MCTSCPRVPLAGGDPWGHEFLWPGIVAACAAGCARPPGANTLGSSHAVGAQRPPAWPYADSSGASGAFDASGAFGAFGAFGFADRLPDRTERNAQRTGAPVAAGEAPAQARRRPRCRVRVRGPDAGARNRGEGPALAAPGGSVNRPDRRQRKATPPKYATSG